MKLKNMKVGRQLRLGLGCILVLVALLGGVAWFQADSLWQETQGLYDHPLAVRRAIGGLTADILTMNSALKDATLSRSEQDVLQNLEEVNAAEADARQQFNILYDRYLGPRKDVDDIHTPFTRWTAHRDNVLRLLRAGRAAEATSATLAGGSSGQHVAEMMLQIQDVSDFALARGDKFYQDALMLRESLKRQLACVLGAILLLTSGIGFILLKEIRIPLRDLNEAAGLFRQGRLEARSRYRSANEFGELSATFNELADTVQAEMEGKDRAARIAEVMLREDEPRDFCLALLRVLLEDTGSQVGAVYLRNDARTQFEHFESIGLGAGAREAFSAAAREGEFGAALATGRIQHINNIPQDTRFTFRGVSGDFQPRAIMTVPVVDGGEVVAVISLASIREYPPAATRLADDVLSVLTARLNGVLAFRKLRDLFKKLESQNAELAAQQGELKAQADELSEQNAELELQKRQLGEASRLKSVFLSNMSHELRTPLNSVIALTGVLGRRLRGAVPEEEYGYLGVIERNGRNLLSLLNDILDLSRVEAGRSEVALERFGVRDLAGEVAAMIEPQAREKGIQLHNLVGEDLPQIVSDYAKCRHIVQNLVGNAVKFTEQGSVEISARQVDGELHLRVADTGIGIKPEQLARIFDEFRQGDESTSRIYGGTGLGLAIAKKYATLLGGRITVASTPGQGSAFTLHLPLALAAPQAGVRHEACSPRGVPAASGGQAAPQDGRGKTILLVEDSEPAIIQLTDILAEQGYRIQVARNGKEALERIAENVPAAMILDLMMPEVDGFEVLRAIRGAEACSRLPVLILTAKHVTREELNFLRGNNIHQLIQKGDIGKAELLAAVGKMVAPPEKQEPPRKKPARRRPEGKPAVLVVEDNPDNMTTVRALLKETCAILEAADGQAALELARSQVPDLMLLDISLPGMDGYKLLDQIRREETLREIPVIALTASAMKGDREAMLAHGFDGYVAKPVDEDQLHQTIREVLDGD